MLIYQRFLSVIFAATCLFLAHGSLSAYAEDDFDNMDEVELNLSDGAADAFFNYKRFYCLQYSDHPTCGYGTSSLGYAYPYLPYYPNLAPRQRLNNLKYQQAWRHGYRW